jgi:arylsulfatase A-like enzyme
MPFVPLLLALAPAAQQVQARIPDRAGLGSVPEVRPNVLLIVVDDLGIDHIDWHPVGVAAGNPAPTPFLSSLAQGSLVFTRAYSNPICGPTRATLLTGRHAFRHGLGGNPTQSEPQLALSETTLMEQLVLGGYATGGFGKWHVSLDRDDPNLQGFQHFDGMIVGLKGASYYAWNRVVNGVGSTETGYNTTVTTDTAIQWIQGQPRRRPWFAYVSYAAPHAPYEPPPPALNPLTNAQATDPTLTIYHGMIEAIDTEVARLVQAVDLQRTLVIFIGDNGSAKVVNQAPVVPGKSKFTAYEGGVIVPALATGAGVDRVGQVDGMFHLVDLFQTILDVAEAPPSPAQTDSVSLVDPTAPPALRWLPQRDEIFTERFEPSGTPPFGTPLLLRRMVRHERYKLYRQVAGDELYDLWQDPWENTNLLLGGLTTEERQAYAELSLRMNQILGS